MGNAELDLANELTQEESPIGVNTLVTDGDSSLYLGMKEGMAKVKVQTSKGDCTRHIMRSVSRNIKKANLSNRCLGERRTVVQKNKNKMALANILERRCSWEFRAAMKMEYTPEQM